MLRPWLLSSMWVRLRKLFQLNFLEFCSFKNILTDYIVFVYFARLFSATTSVWVRVECAPTSQCRLRCHPRVIADITSRERKGRTRGIYFHSLLFYLKLYMSNIKLYFIQPPEGASKSTVSEKEIWLKCQLYKFYTWQLKPQRIPFHAIGFHEGFHTEDVRLFSCSICRIILVNSFYIILYFCTILIFLVVWVILIF